MFHENLNILFRIIREEGGIGKSVEKNRQGFNERQADAVGQRSSCLVPLPPHLQTRGWGLP